MSHRLEISILNLDPESILELHFSEKFHEYRSNVKASIWFGQKLIMTRFKKLSNPKLNIPDLYFIQIPEKSENIQISTKFVLDW